MSRLLSAAALVAALVIPSAAFAQQAPAPSYPTAAPGQTGARHGHHHRNGFRTALRGLNLSSAQQTQIRQVFEQNRTANRNADPATRKADRARVRSQIEAILTPAQRAQLQTSLQQAKARRK